MQMHYYVNYSTLIVVMSNCLHRNQIPPLATPHPMGKKAVFNENISHEPEQ